ncbi:MAG: hypothetical protein ABW135_18365 [Thermoleophilaceae bacterium]
MTPFAHHAGEHLIVAAAMGSGLSGSLLFLRAGIAQLARRRGWRRT